MTIQNILDTCLPASKVPSIHTVHADGIQLLLKKGWNFLSASLRYCVNRSPIIQFCGSSSRTEDVTTEQARFTNVLQ